MQARNENRNSVNNGHPGGYAMSPTMYSAMGQGQLQYCLPGAPYAPMQKEDMAAAFGNLSVYNGAGNGYYWPSGMNNLPANSGMHYRLRDGRILPSQLGNPQNSYQTTNDLSGYQHAQFMGQGLQYPSGNGMQANAQTVGWNGPQQFSRETPVPDLAAPRRSSLSSNEENGPHTPFFGAGTRTDFQPKVAFADSPQAWTTPSPQQLVQPLAPEQIFKSPNGQYMRMDLDAVCMQEPPIPKPVPAIFSGEKGRGTLDKSLQNNLNTTNVYIRGLHPNTTDEMLKSYGLRFGDIVSAKSMLDQETGNCKGFGFIKYHNFVDGENCIRAFFHWGYEAKWARVTFPSPFDRTELKSQVSHNEKLKTLGDENNTNLYVSNLPLDFNEHTLMATFDDYEVLSAKILRDANGLSRGVGFARFASPEICMNVIEQYNSKKVGDDGAALSIRFADTPKQKELKTITAERRNYKAHEYNTAVYSPGSPYIATTSLATTVPSPLASRASIASGTYWPTTSAAIPSAYGAYTTTTSSFQSPTLANMTAIKAPGSENIAPKSAERANSSSDVKQDSISDAALAKRTSHVNVQSPVKSEGENVSEKCSATGQGEAKSSPIKPTKYSPTKTTPSKANVNLLRL